MCVLTCEERLKMSKLCVLCDNRTVTDKGPRESLGEKDELISLTDDGGVEKEG